MKLASITIGVSIHELPHVAHIDMEKPSSPWVVGWTVSIDGPSVFLSSPPGWSRSGSERSDQAVTTIEVPRAACSMRWIGPMESTAKFGPQKIGESVVPKKR